ncbi:glycine--tRNA ligase subunit beta [Litoreibacter albidus]|uniref:Glycine--tRNA ligase beta subunit n=1 Tax=Litoreibacter albidus TaxID=670155 RepID=A0A1H2SBX0_9RHOB|nr:glycine--tRNA ligase subunit beta [Litoreibacter albidus]SDW29080.1 glycyl-tRNA synthetase beta chain [Litoreibacter albidus]
MPDLLIELFSEEIPARMQGKAADDLKKLVTNGLVEAGLTYASAGAFSTPRRLTLSVDGLLAASPAVKEERKGPKVGAPEQAMAGFLRSTGLSEDQLEARDDKKGQVWFAVIDKPGRPAAEIVAEVLEHTIRTFPWPKSMRWGAGTLRWVRPLHSILCILSDETGAEVVDLDIDGIKSGDTTRGHRFMAPDAFSVTSFDDYAAKLKRAKVVLDASERADHIWADATNQAFAQGMEVVEDRGLLAEVAGLVEWPVVLMGKIEEQFLDLPPEVLKTSMKEHQKFFSVKNPKSGRIEQYVTVANIETSDQGATILAGNGRVLSARLADGKFFWENDLRIAKGDKMQPWIDALENVTFHNKLGSQKERIERIAALAREIAPAVGADPDLAEQAARVAKADLSSEMVYEFPELQGLMGRYYADAAGMPPEVGAACEEHYSPLGPSDDVPTAPVSVAVALADKIDTFTAFWAMNELPSGSKDPYALRRSALGLFRLLSENNHNVSIAELLHRSFDERLAVTAKMLRNVIGKEASDEKKAIVEEELLIIQATAEKRKHSLLTFLHDRLKVFLKDKGVRHDIIDACIAMEGSDDLNLLVKRAEALSDALKTDDGENLIQGFKRANNILSKEEEKDGVSYELDPDIKFAENDEEKALFKALDTAEAVIKPAMEQGDFATAMAAMAKLRGPIDAFFEATQVNSDNPIVRRNRLCLLHRIRTICGGVADLTKVEG